MKGFTCILHLTIFRKLLCLLLFSMGSMFIVLSGQDVLERRVSLKLKSASLETAIEELSEKSELDFGFVSEQLSPRLRDFNYQELPLGQVLQLMLSPENLEYQLLGGQIVIFRRLGDGNKYTLSGFVRDSLTGEPLLGATVLEQIRGEGAVTNAYGFYSLTLSSGQVLLHSSYTGYASRDTSMFLGRDIRHNIEMNPSITLAPVVVIGRDSLPPVENTVLPSEHLSGTAQITVEQIENVPSLGGEGDVIRLASLFAGVKTGTDGLEGLHIRGGGNGENLILMDGVPVYDVSHAGGLFSVFNSHAIRSAKLIKGSFPARYGGRLSGVLDVRTKEGNRKKWSGIGEISMLSARAALEGPLVKDKSSAFLAMRFSILDTYTRPISKDFKADRGEIGATTYGFSDINAKWNYSFSQKDHIYLSWYQGKDEFDNYGYVSDTFFIETSPTELARIDVGQRYQERLTWGNRVGALRWNHLFSDRLFANLTATFSRLDVRLRTNQRDTIEQVFPQSLSQINEELSLFHSAIEDIALKLDFEFSPNPAHKWRWGAKLTRQQFRPGALVLNDISDITIDTFNLGNDPITLDNAAVYLEDEWELGRELRVNAGLRLSGFFVRSANYIHLQPRLAVSWRPHKRFTFTGGLSKMVQSLHLLSNSSIGLPTDLRVPVTDNISPASVWQFNLGQTFRLTPEVLFSAEGYYKSLRDLLRFSEGAFFLNDWEGNVTSGEGTARGLEFSIRKPEGKTQFWVNYTLAETTRRFELINLGRSFPHKYDRRHEASLLFVQQVRPWLSLSLDWTYSTGFAFSLPRAKYVDIGEELLLGEVVVLVYDGINEQRMPAYHRLNISGRAQFQTGFLKHQVKLGVYNAYDRRNPLYFAYRERTTNEDNRLTVSPEFVQVWLFPVLPTISYGISF